MAMANTPSSRCLYHWLGEWQVHNKHLNSLPRNLKFQATSTSTITAPPLDCQHTTVTKNATFYTAMASFGHITTPNTPIDWKAHLANLPEDIKWIFTHSNIQKTSLKLVETLASKPLTAVSNGSYSKDTQGMATWVVYKDSAPKTAISLGVLTTPGHAMSQSSNHSKLVGIYDIITTITMVSKFYQINHGTVQVICDSKSTLKCCFKQQVCNPTKKL